MVRWPFLALLATFALTILIGCGTDPVQTTEPTPVAPSTPGEIAIPESVRRTLGITFGRAELRRVESTRRLPGRFELATDSRRDYAVPLPGIVELHVRQYDTVTTGQLLFTVDSREWRTIQSNHAALTARVQQTSAALVQAENLRHASELATSVSLGRERAGVRHKESLRQVLESARAEYQQLLSLQQRFGGKVIELNEARTRMANAEAALRLAEEETLDMQRELLRLTTEGGGAFGPYETIEAHYRAQKEEYFAALAQLQASRSTLASILQVPLSQLDDPIPAEDGTTAPRWLATDLLRVHSRNAGIVRSVVPAAGSHVESGTPVLSVVDLHEVLFVAPVLQSDMAHYAPGMECRILPPGNQASYRELPAQTLGFVMGDPDQRTARLAIQPTQKADWAMEGVAASVDVVTDDTGEEVLVVPRAAITRDGLDTILFRRDPEHPDRAIRLIADLGLVTDNWAVIESGLAAGDEVILGGIQQIKLATQGTQQAMGHFHADGTWHEGTH